MNVTILKGASTSCRCQLHVCWHRHKRESRTSTKSDVPLSSTLLSSSFGIRGDGCSAVMFDSSKNGSDFLFLVWRWAPCDPDLRPDERELDSCLTII